MGMHQLPVNNFIVYYLVDDEVGTVTVVRIFYGGRDIEEIVNSLE
jgi:toxin ParE1/3/4